MENQIETKRRVPGIYSLSKEIDMSLGMVDSLPFSLEPGYVFVRHQEGLGRRVIPMPGRIVEKTEDGHNIRIIPYETSKHGDKKIIHVFPHNQSTEEVNRVYDIMTNQ